MGWTKIGVVRIKRLTPKQEDQIPLFAEKWNKIARCTDPWNKEDVTAGIKRFYKAMGCRQPKRGVWYNESPLGAWKSARYKWEYADKRNPNFGRLNSSETSLRCFLTQSFEPAVIKLVEDFMHRNVARSLHGGRIDPGGASWQERDHDLFYGQTDAPWLAIADYFATVHGNERCKKFEGLMQAIASCGFVWLTPDKVVYANRPEIAKFDDRGWLHCEDGPAIKYRDGWSWYFLNGVATPKKYIETPADQINIEDVLKENNSAVRMAVLRKVGFARLLSSVPNRVISRSNDNALIQFRINGGWPIFYRVLHLKWQDKTGPKETILPVPRTQREFGDDRPTNVNDCEQVRRWTLGWPKEALAVAET